MDVKTASVLPKALYPTTNSITRSELNPELNQSQGNVEVPEAKTVSVLPKALYPTTNSITKSELNPESVRQLFAEFQKSFCEITQKSLSEWKSQVRVEAVEATQTQLHFPPQSHLQTQYEEPQALPKVPVPHIQVPEVLSQP